MPRMPGIGGSLGLHRSKVLHDFIWLSLHAFAVRYPQTCISSPCVHEQCTFMDIYGSACNATVHVYITFQSRITSKICCCWPNAFFHHTVSLFLTIFCPVFHISSHATPRTVPRPHVPRPTSHLCPILPFPGTLPHPPPHAARNLSSSCLCKI